MKHKSLTLSTVLFFLAGSVAIAAELKLSPAQQQAADKLRAKGAAVMQLAADSDALTVNLGIVGKAIGDEDVALVKELPSVTQLDLHGTGVTDAGLASLEGMTGLTHLHLNGTQVTDAGVAHLKGLSGLTYLNLYNTAVTDAGVEQLKNLKNLKRLYLWQTKVTDAGSAALKSANPSLVVNRGEELKPVTMPSENAADAKPLAAGKPVNSICPVSGKPVDPAHTLLYEGKTVGFCCEKCPVEFEKDPKKFAVKLAELTKDADAKPGDKPAAPKKGKKKAAVKKPADPDAAKKDDAAGAEPKKTGEPK